MAVVADLLEAEPVAEAGDQGRLAPAVGAENASAVRPIAGYIQIPDEAWLILVQFTGSEPA